ncbi:glycosyltransferase family 4 protein [Altererythrobacter sp. KTW20L]|uniref:glycosyltransferase family 4 protein n=1 Tax=Altererythrobacter sp. KTW20L TaxID=2942210 RepID=UPI0020BE812E|nr:glycosyltransferase family 4 protein [Altererythrobacter sp. KTW20L]MCL6249529.1 glycosyltransferase family 4 protein [Altererythrobacter sp. KTW20L]
MSTSKGPTDKDQAEAEVMFVTRKWAPATGGMETYSLRLTHSLKERIALDVVALSGRSSNMPPGIPALLAFPITVFRRLRARAFPPRVVHLGDLAIWPLGLLVPRRAHVVLSAHGTDVAYHRRGGLRGRLYGAYLRLGARLMRRASVIANSRATAEILGETGWRASAVIPLATERIPQLGTVGHPEPFILFAGRLVKRKGCGWFIANVLPLLDPSLRLVVAGTKWDVNESALLDNPRVTFLGPLGQAELARLFATATCVVVPNIDVASGEYEGFGLVAPEAAGCGGVVLAARTGGLCDAVLDGETGFLLEPGDAHAWAAKIADVEGWTGAERSAFTQQAQQRALAYYAWDRVADETAAIYSGG